MKRARLEEVLAQNLNDPEGEVQEDEQFELKYEAVGLPSREEERNELGIPQCRDQCFACTYVGEREMGAVPFEEVMKLIDQIRKNVAKTKLSTLVVDVADQYARLQKTVNSHLLPGEKPLPDWRAATILEHIRSHTNDPELKIWVILDNLNQLSEIALFASVERDQTGRQRINERQMKCYSDLIKLTLQVYRSKPSDMMFYSGGAHMDIKSASEGPISMSGKRVMKLWQK
jgi:hypothetical protein